MAPPFENDDTEARQIAELLAETVALSRTRVFASADEASRTLLVLHLRYLETRVYGRPRTPLPMRNHP